MRVFTVSESWGPLKSCRCGQESWTIVLTDEENATLPEQSGPMAVAHILTHKLGVICCSKCTPLMLSELKDRTAEGGSS